MKVKLLASKYNEVLKRGVSSFGVNSITVFIILSSLTISAMYTIVRYSTEIINGGHPNLTGDWLINYEGGYAHRGLNGQLLLVVSDYFGLNLLWLTYIEQSLLYFIFAYSVIRIFSNIKGKFLWLMALNPAFMLFDFLDTGGVFRKELIGLVCVSLLFKYRTRAKVSNFGILIVPLLYTLMSFSWDLGSIFLPIILYSYYRLKQQEIISQLAYKVSAAYFLAVTGGSFAGILYFISHRNQSISIGICDSLTERGIESNICGSVINSITMLELDLFSRAKNLLSGSDYPWYLPVLILAVIPICWSGWIKVNVNLTILIFFSVLPLWITEIDYGRNIHILITLLTLSWAIDGKVRDVKRLDLHKLPSTFRNQLCFLIFSILYTLSWRVPHAGGLPRAAFLGVFGRILSWF